MLPSNPDDDDHGKLSQQNLLVHGNNDDAIDNDEFLVESDLEEIADDIDYNEADPDHMIVDDNSEDSDTDDDVQNFPISPDDHPLALVSKAVRRFSHHSDEVYWCDINSTDTLAITGDRNNMAFVWNLTTLEVFLQCTDHTESVIGVGFSYDGKYVATGDVNGLIRVWDLSEKKVIYENSIDGLEWLMWHKKCNALFAVETNGHAYMWLIPSGQCKVFAGSGRGSQCSLFTSDGLKVLVGYTNGHVTSFDLKSTSVLSSYRAEIEDCIVTGIDIHANDEMFAAGFSNGTIIVASLTVSKEYARFQAKDEVGDVVFVTGNEVYLLAVGTRVGIEIWDYSLPVVRSFVNVPRIDKLLYNRELKLLCASSFGRIFLINPFNHTVYYILEGSGNRIYHMALSSNGKSLVAVGKPNTCEIFDMENMASSSHMQRNQ